MGQRTKIKTDDLQNIKEKLEAGFLIKDIAEEYGYYDGSALKRGLKVLGYRVTDTLVPI